MATKPDAAKSEVRAPAKGPIKKKKWLLMGGLALLVLALAGGGAWFYFNKKSALDEAGDELVQEVPKGPPTYLPLDNMVVNLADPGGEKVAQIGITLELADSKATDTVRMYLPTIRSGVLLLISQRTAEELLAIAGKEQLAADILREASRPFGGAEGGGLAAKPRKDPAKAPKRKSDRGALGEGPVLAVHFSSFIVQ